MKETNPLLVLLLLVATSYGAYRFYLFPIRLGDDELAVLQSAAASLDEGVAAHNEENHRIIKGMSEMVAKEGNEPEKLLLVKKAEAIRDSTARMITRLDQLQKLWSTETGRVSLSDSAAKAFTASLDHYVKYLSTRSGLVFRPITHVPDASGAPGEFSNFYFRSTLVHVARYTMARLRFEVYACEGRALDALSRNAFHSKLRFDRFRFMPMLSAESNLVGEGGMYRAKLFMAHIYHEFDGQMACNGKPIPVVDGIGQVRFKAEAIDFDKNGLSKQEWVGTIPMRFAYGDTVFTIRETYFVRKKKTAHHE